MDEIDAAALKLKAEYPSCRDVIDREVVRLREEIAERGVAPISIQEDLINLRSRVQDYPCAKSRRRRSRLPRGRSWSR